MNMNQVLGIVFFTTTIFTSAQAGTTVYIPLGTGNMVIAVDAATDKIIAKYPNINNAHGLVATSDGEYLIAGSLNENQSSTTDPSTPSGNLYLVHPAHGHMMSAIPAVGSSHHQAITPDDKYVISTHSGRGSISFMDMSTYKTVKEIKTGIVPNYTIISKNGTYAYV
ncbi:MAG: YncE family protein, partial [Gammaproteobacteria bacterium]|nr:YncE family protein [Gammaproteobacteria bacterium]